MKKTIVLSCILLIIAILAIHAPVRAEDKSFTIHDVQIHVEVDEEGIMHVSELFTYAFDGVFGGTERSILANVSGFKAYEVPNNKDVQTLSTEGLDELYVENDEDLYRIHIPSEDEEKHVLYTYEITNEIDKYADVADVVYDFFPSSNNNDLGKLEITWEFLGAPSGEVHAFIHGHADATVTVHGSEVIYTHEAFEAGMSAALRIIVPVEAVAAMPLTKDVMMGEKLINAEQTNIEKTDAYVDRLGNIQPAIYVAFVLLIGGMIWWYRIHPNYYRFGAHENIRKALPFFENTDPLFVSYLQVGGYVSALQSGLVSALLSLKRRGIVSMKEVPSEKDGEKMTYAFTWENKNAEVDDVDAYVRSWLFEKEDDDKEQFLFESIIVDEDESSSVKEEKIEKFSGHYQQWTKLLKDREAFTGWYEPYPVYGYVSILCTLIAYALFSYVLSITPIHSVLQYSLLIGIGICALAALIWNKNKWVISLFYFFLLPTLLIASMWSIHLLPVALFIFGSWIGLLSISARKWAPEVVKLTRLLRVARRLFKRKEYPVDEKALLNERRLETAIALGVGKQYAEQIGKQVAIYKGNTLHTPLLHNPAFAGTVFHPSNMIFYTAMASGSTSTSSTSSSPTSGSGGAGAF